MAASPPATPEPSEGPAAACPNCFAAFAGPRPKFCPECGQETHVRAPKLGEFLQQLGGAYLATEGALWRTLKLLLLQPGELTAQYLAGRRKHYVLPLRLFLTITLLMLLTMRVVGSIEAAKFDDPEVRRALPERPKSMHIELGYGQAGTAAFVLLPAFALGLSLLFRARGLRYTEHLVFALHLHAFWFLLAALMMLGVEVLVWGGALMMPLYGVLAMRRVYGGPWWALGLRAVVLGAAHLALVALTVAVVTLAALLL